MRLLRPYTTVTVRTSDARYRHLVVRTVASQDQITGRIGLVGNSASVTATRQASTTTRGEEFAQ